jgi:DNA-directed RNA polymerase subunit beta
MTSRRSSRVGAAALIPFLEDDDANRALMGSNMQRQACRWSSRRAVRGHRHGGRGAAHSGAACRRPPSAWSSRSTAPASWARYRGGPTAPGVDIYRLQSSSAKPEHLHQPASAGAVASGKRGDVIADGPSTDLGELALGRNALVAFMPGTATTSRTRS